MRCSLYLLFYLENKTHPIEIQNLKEENNKMGKFIEELKAKMATGLQLKPIEEENPYKFYHKYELLKS